MTSGSVILDVFVEGLGVRRDARLTLTTTSILCDEISVPYGDVFWLSRRAGMLMVFAGWVTLAVKGSSQELDRLYQQMTTSVDVTELRRSIVRQLGHEVVLFTGGCAANGTIGGRKVGGLFVAAATRRALYLLSGGRQLSVEWPARAARRRPARSADRGDHDSDYLAVSRGDTSLTVRYLFPEELGAVLFAASKQPQEPAVGRPLELFSRREVSPPTPADLPEFSLAAGSLQEVAERAAANVPGELCAQALLEPYYFETHFLELGEIALGPLLLRKSAASSADSLHRAVKAMNAGGLQDDTRAAVATASDRMLAAYDAELKRLLALKRVAPRQEKEFQIPPVERAALAARMQAPFDRLWGRFEGLAEQETELIRRLATLDAGPPDEDDTEVREAAEEWRATLSRLDSGYDGAWRELVEEIERSWSTELLPRLTHINEAERRRVPEWVQLAALAFMTLLLAAALVFVVFG
jgi:hypothetical protein